MKPAPLFLAHSNGMDYDIYAAGETPDQAFALWCAAYKKRAVRQFKNPRAAFDYHGGRILPIVAGNTWTDGSEMAEAYRGMTKDITRLLDLAETAYLRDGAE